MRTYRKAVADAFAMQNLLMYLSERADDFASSAEDYRTRAEAAEKDDLSDTYYRTESAEYAAKAAAFERLLEKLSK